MKQEEKRIEVLVTKLHEVLNKTYNFQDKKLDKRYRNKAIREMVKDIYESGYNQAYIDLIYKQ